MFWVAIDGSLEYPEISSDLCNGLDELLIRLGTVEKGLAVTEGSSPAAERGNIILGTAIQLNHKLFLKASDGSDKPYRVKVRAPSFANLQTLQHLLREAYVADSVVILGSIDIVLGEVDR